MNVSLPENLRDRARDIGKRVHKATTVLIREGLLERCKYYEAELAEFDHAKEVAEKAKESKGRKLKSLAESAAPGAAAAARVDEAITAEDPPVENELQKIYAEHAKKILPVLDQPLERRMRAQEAILAIRRAAPLTHPLDGDILVALEREVLKLKATTPAPSTPLTAAPEAPRNVADRLTRFLDDFVGRAIDPGRVKTKGDV